MRANIISTLLLLLIATSISAKNPNRDKPIYIANICDTIVVDGLMTDSAWQNSTELTQFKDYWQRDRDEVQETSLRVLHNGKYIYFYYHVNDTTPIFTKGDIRDKMEIGGEDRVEIFLSRSDTLATYLAFEIDQKGRNFDYRAKHYRKFEYSWSSYGVEIATTEFDGGYTVEGAIPIELLNNELTDETLPKNEFYWGCFRADFYKKPNGKKGVKWLCHHNPKTRVPDFHTHKAMWRIILFDNLNKNSYTCSYK